MKQLIAKAQMNCFENKDKNALWKRIKLVRAICLDNSSSREASQSEADTLMSQLLS